MSTLEGVEKEVVVWSKTTFPNATKEALREKFNEEFNELFEAMVMKPGDRFKELADVCIVAIRELHDSESSLSEIIAAKLAINQGREWGLELPDGNRERVK